jgi:hypothetical protein
VGSIFQSLQTKWLSGVVKIGTHANRLKKLAPWFIFEELMTFEVYLLNLKWRVFAPDIKLNIFIHTLIGINNLDFLNLCVWILIFAQILINHLHVEYISRFKRTL